MPGAVPCRVVLLAVAALGALAAAEGQAAVLPADDECLAAGPVDRADCALNALQHRTARAEAVSRKTAAAGTTMLSLYHWSPHWQCFWNNSRCAGPAMGSLNSELKRFKVDFGSVIELLDSNYRPPAGYRYTRSSCNLKETATLIYDASRWRPGSAQRGCMRFKDRAFVVQTFTSTNAQAVLNRVIVVAAHYPHSPRVPILKGAINRMVRATGERRIVVLADTNQEIESIPIASYLHLPSAQNIIASPMFVTCCHHIHQGFVFPYDRIISNFGESMTAHLLHGSAPHWAAISMHKGIHAVITAIAEDGVSVTVRSVPSSQGGPPEKLEPTGNSTQSNTTQVGPPEAVAL